jgi:ATP-dependent phosphofructokinase / diphosphate-dependent phosphofructokinase
LRNEKISNPKSAIRNQKIEFATFKKYIMIRDVGHTGMLRRVAINVGAGYLPGINTVITGAARAAGLMGWEIVGIRDGFQGLLHPDRYPSGGLVTLSPQMIADVDPLGEGILGQAPMIDPFHDTTQNDGDKVAEVDHSDEILKRLKAENIDALISVVGNQGLGILYKLHRKGIPTVCIPKSIENDIPATSISFGFNTALSFTIDMLVRAKHAARMNHKVAIVEVIGDQAGWLAMQAGIAISADAVLIPEILYNLNMLARRLDDKMSARKPYGLVIVANGVKLCKNSPGERDTSSVEASLKPVATEPVMIPDGKTAETLVKELRLLTGHEAYPLVIGPWARAGSPTAIDLQLGMAYGAGAINALKASKNGVMVAFAPPEIKYVPLAEVIDKVRIVTADSEFLNIAGSLGIYYGNFSSKKL